MKIGQVANIYQGITIQRIKRGNEKVDKRLIYSFVEGEENYIDIPIDEELRSEIPLTKKDIVLINLTSHRASIISEKEEGQVIPSTYIIIEAGEKVCPSFLEWYMNEDWDFYKRLQVIKQGSIIQSIPIHEFKQIKINLPPMEVQEKIGRINQIVKMKRKLYKEKEKLTMDILKYLQQKGTKDDKKSKTKNSAG